MRQGEVARASQGSQPEADLVASAHGQSMRAIGVREDIPGRLETELFPSA